MDGFISETFDIIIVSHTSDPATNYQRRSARAREEKRKREKERFNNYYFCFLLISKVSSIKAGAKQMRCTFNFSFKPEITMQTIFQGKKKYSKWSCYYERICVLMFIDNNNGKTHKVLHHNYLLFTTVHDFYVEFSNILMFAIYNFCAVE